MNKVKTKKKRIDYPVVALGVAVLTVAVVMIVTLCSPKDPQMAEFTPPAFESAAVAGTPEVPDDLGYCELYQDGMAYRFSICGAVTMNGNTATVYFTSPESNEKWLKLRVLDAEGNVLGETGLIKPGEYVQTVELTEALAEGTAIKLKIMGYEPETYTSAGSVNLNTVIGGGS